MSKTSLHNALHKEKSTPEVSQSLKPDLPPKKTKKIIVEVPSDAHYQIDKMRLEMRRNSMKELMIEALNDLFLKHGYPPVA